MFTWTDFGGIYTHIRPRRYASVFLSLFILVKYVVISSFEVYCINFSDFKLARLKLYKEHVSLLSPGQLHLTCYFMYAFVIVFGGHANEY